MTETMPTSPDNRTTANTCRLLSCHEVHTFKLRIKPIAEKYLYWQLFIHLFLDLNKRLIYNLLYVCLYVLVHYIVCYLLFDFSFNCFLSYIFSLLHLISLYLWALYRFVYFDCSANYLYMLQIITRSTFNSKYYLI